MSEFRGTSTSNIKPQRNPQFLRMPCAIVDFTGKCPGKMEITGGPLEIDVLEFIRFHPLERDYVWTRNVSVHIRLLMKYY